jgi:hypothetical protein
LASCDVTGGDEIGIASHLKVLQGPPRHRNERGARRASGLLSGEHTRSDEGSGRSRFGDII